jgi:acyl-CoA dehydrogenase
MWDFSTDAETTDVLDWMRDFVNNEVEPLETLDLGDAALRHAMEPLKRRVKSRGLWAAHLPPEHGGEGFGQVRLALMHEIIGRSYLAPLVFGNQAPDSGNGELLASRHRRPKRRSGSTPSSPVRSAVASQ